VGPVGAPNNINNLQTMTSQTARRPQAKPKLSDRLPSLNALFKLLALPFVMAGLGGSGLEALFVSSTGLIEWYEHALMFISGAAGGAAIGLQPSLWVRAIKSFVQENEIEQKDRQINQLQNESRGFQRSLSVSSGDSLRGLERQSSLLDVRISLLEDYIMNLDVIKGMAVPEAKEQIETRLVNLKVQRGKLQGRQEELEARLTICREEGDSEDRLSENSAHVIEKLEETAKHLNSEIAILNEFMKDLNRFGLPILPKPTQDKINHLQQRKGVRDAELVDIGIVVEKVQAEGLDPSGYEYVGFLGMGAMGVAIKAYYPAEDRFVAVKIKLGQSSQEEMLRFNSEAEIAVELEHKCIAKGFGFSANLSNGQIARDFLRYTLERANDGRLQLAEHPDDAEYNKHVLMTALREGQGFPYYTTELIRGYSLENLLSNLCERREKVPYDMALNIAEQVVLAMQYYSQAGLIHRDLKPDNIMLRIDLPHEKQGFVKIIDFGIAKQIAGGNLTRTGITMGTPIYMSTEQLMASKDLSIKTDLYALGCILYEMVAGKPLHEGFNRPSDLIISTTVGEAIPNFPQLRELITDMIKEKAADRPDFDDILVKLDECRSSMPSSHTRIG